MKNLCDRICKAITIVTVVGLSLLFISPFAIMYMSIKKSDASPKGHYTESIADYNTEEYPLYDFVFLDELPTDVEVVNFICRDYYNEDYDQYLELRFDNVLEMQSYLETLIEHSRQALAERDFSWNGGEAFIEDKNPYDESYTELFGVSPTRSEEDERFVGYEIEQLDDCMVYSCYCAIISFSYEDLTVIQTYCYGSFVEGTEYVPRYLERFNVPLNKELLRRISLKN